MVYELSVCLTCSSYIGVSYTCRVRTRSFPECSPSRYHKHLICPKNDVMRTYITCGPQFSKLESTLVSANPEPRPISKDGQHVFRHHNEEDLDVNELDFDYNVDPNEWPLLNVESVQDLFSNVMYREHVSKDGNFSTETAIECFRVDGDGAQWLHLDQCGLQDVLENAKERCVQTPAIPRLVQPGPGSPTRSTLIFFVPLIPSSSGTSYQHKLPLAKSSVNQLFSWLQLNPGFLPNLLGRPDYWAPQPRWDEEDGHFLSCDLFLQLPRWSPHTADRTSNEISPHT